MCHTLADPVQRHRIAEIRDNLTARIAESEYEGWLGEAEDKLAQIVPAPTPPTPTSAFPLPPGNPNTNRQSDLSR